MKELVAVLAVLVGMAVILGYWEFGLFIVMAVIGFVLLWPKNEDARDARRRNR